MGALSSDPDFRAAVRAWEIATAPRPRMASSELEADLQSTERARRTKAEKEVAENFARMMLAAYRWARMNPKETDLNAAVGRNMHAMIRWVATAFNLSEEKGIRFETAEREVVPKAGDTGGQTTKGRVLSEVMPPCWSPRWSQERALLRTHSPAEMLEAELLNFIIANLLEVDVGVTKVLAEQKKHKEARNLDRAISLQHSALSRRLSAFIRSVSERMAESEAVSKGEADQMRQMTILAARARDSAWRLLRKDQIPREPKTPREQETAVNEWLDDGDATGKDAANVELVENPYRRNGRFKYGR